MTAIHDLFPPDDDDENDPLSLKKLRKLEGQFALNKEILGFDFDGTGKTLILCKTKRAFLLSILQKWIRASSKGRGGIPFNKFESVVAKIWHAFLAIAPLSMQSSHRVQATNSVPSLQQSPLPGIERFPSTAMQGNVRPNPVQGASYGRGSIRRHQGCFYPWSWRPHCRPYQGICVPTVFRMEWPPDIQEEVAKTNARKNGKLTNLDLEMGGLILLWLVMEEVCQPEPGKHIALFSDNSPTVSWTRRMAARG
jgi:hypothetical protein